MTSPGREHALAEEVLELDETATCPVCGSTMRLHRLEITRWSEALPIKEGTYWWRLVCTQDWSHIVDRPQEVNT